MLWERLRRRGRGGAAPDPGPAFVDPRIDDEVHRRGFVVVELLDPDDLAALWDIWADIEREFPPVWDPTGLATTLRHPGADLAADARIRPIVERALDGVLVDRVPFMSAFLLKRPGSDQLPAHIDWRMVDSPDTVTHGCWVPLEDTSPEHGALGVVPGSHLLVDFDRTPEDPGHEWTEDLMAAGAERLVLDVPAGHAVIYDHRLIHFSETNESARIRVAVNTAVAPRDQAAGGRARLLGMMARGMAGAGGGPQIPDAGPEA